VRASSFAVLAAATLLLSLSPGQAPLRPVEMRSQGSGAAPEAALRTPEDETLRAALAASFAPGREAHGPLATLPALDLKSFALEGAAPSARAAVALPEPRAALLIAAAGALALRSAWRRRRR
jgi:hypothetical protein